MNNSIWNIDSDKGIRDDANPLLNAQYRVQLIRQANRQIPVSERPPVPKPAVLLCDALDVADAKLKQADRTIAELNKLTKEQTDALENHPAVAEAAMLMRKLEAYSTILTDAHINIDQLHCNIGELQKSINYYNTESLFAFIKRKLGW